MADISKIKLPNGTTYDLKDADARSMIDALDGSITGTAGASKTLTAFSQANGKVSATFGNISITKSQVSDFPAFFDMDGYGIALASGDNIATLPVGSTYYSGASSISASLAGDPPATNSGFKIVTLQEYSTARRRQIAFGNGSEKYWHRYSTDSGTTWSSWVSPFDSQPSGGGGGGKTSLWSGAITSGSATLSDSVANYDMILVVASNGQTGTSFVSTMCDQAGTFNVGWEASAAYIEFTLSGSTITINNASTGRYLRRVVGYKLSGDANYTNADSTSY